MTSLDTLVIKLVEAKEVEDRAKAARMAVEAELAAAIGVPDSWTGSTTSDICGYKVTCRRGENVKIDTVKLDEIINAGGDTLADAANSVFRWKPEIDKKGWESADPSVCRAFAPAITRTPGKIGFTLKTKESK